MDLQTFKAATMSEALSQVKQSLGKDAVILHTRKVESRKWLGLRKRAVVEITAGRGENIGNVKLRSRASAPKAPNVHAGLSRNDATTNLAPGRELLTTTAASNAMMMGISQEISSLKLEMRKLVTQVRSSGTPDVPEDLFEHYQKLIENQVAEELAGDIVQTLKRSVRAEYLGNQDFMREKIAEQLEKLLPTSGPIQKTKATGSHVVALIGPTGVGKTTTIAKLAANMKLREKQRVGLITIDTYRIAAIDQLKKYSDIIGAPLKVVASPDDLAHAIESMKDCDYILIDTAGRSPNDTLKLNELRAFLASAKPDEVHLVLSTTASISSVELAIERFSQVRVDKIIFTKLDEAAHVGVVLNVARKVNKSLSYVTTGQDVPNDIEVSRGRTIAQMIIGGGK